MNSVVIDSLLNQQGDLKRKKISQMEAREEKLLVAAAAFGSHRAAGQALVPAL